MPAKKTAAAKKPAAKKTAPELKYEDGFWYIHDGKTTTNVGRSRRYAENMLEQYEA